MADRYDIVIVGAAGFTAGIHAARRRCRTLPAGRKALDEQGPAVAHPSVT